MANLAKYDRSQIGGLTRHFERHVKKDGQYQKFSNQEIDTGRTHLNYNLAPERDGGQLAFIKQRTSEVKCQNRADVNVMCSWVVTAPKSMPDNEHELFFKEVYKFLNNRYAGGSDRNVISAYVHMDETTPHLHYAYVPVVHDPKKNIDKVSAKILHDRNDLKSFHVDLERHMATIFGREVGILNEATKDGNKDVQTLKRETAILEAKKELAEAVKPIADKLAGANTINKFRAGKAVEQKQYGITGTKGVFIPDVTLQDVEFVAEGAQRRESSVASANKRVKEIERQIKAVEESAEQERKEIMDIAEKRVTAADAEVVKQKTIADTAVAQWDEIIDYLKEQGIKMGDAEPTYDDILTIVKWYAKERETYKKDADIVPQLKKDLEKYRRSASVSKLNEQALQRALRRTENALIKGFDAIKFTRTQNGAEVGFDYYGFINAIKAEKPEHRVLEHVMERDRELYRMLNRDIDR